MARLTKLKCSAYRYAGKAAMVMAFPFFAIDKAFDWLSNVVTILCALAVVPNIIFYDWCVKRHNAIRARAALSDLEERQT